jgi:GNAT superfamily N-acetyltransferase
MFISVSLIRIPDEFAWDLGTPRGVEERLSADDISAIASLLASGIEAVLGPKGFDTVIGPRNLVDALIDGWVAHVNRHGELVKALDPIFTSKVSYATKASLPPLRPIPAHFKIEKAATPEDIDAIQPLMIDLLTNGPDDKPDVDQIRRALTNGVAMGHVWVCRIDGEVAGYGSVGRSTPRTIAIRNVYVAASHRRKGIAEVLTSTIVRYYLGEPTGLEGLEAPVEGVKEEVCLNVTEEAVERIYKRCGFLLDQEEPGTRQIGWFHTSLRGVQYL